MKLSDLDLNSESFFEDEIEALENLPQTEEGLRELLDYLDEMDSPAGYDTLFEKFRGRLSPEQFSERKERFFRYFDFLSEEDLYQKYGI